jgi:SAM-dependent methyltransferase
MKYLISLIIRKVPRKYLQLFSHHVLRILAFIYKGKKIECNICGHTYRALVPYGRKPPRENALCPDCLSLERHRLLWLFLQRHTDFFTARHKVLHIAPEICFIDRFEKMENLEYITGDLESPLAKVMLDVHQIPFQDNSFDISFCNHVMEHVEDDIKAMSEIHRILKPGGWAIIQSPINRRLEKTYEDPRITDPEEREEAFGQNDHVRMFGRDYKQRLEKAGFTVEEFDMKKELTRRQYRRYALPKQEIIFLCKKK